MYNDVEFMLIQISHDNNNHVYRLLKSLTSLKLPPQQGTLPSLFSVRNLSLIWLLIEKSFCRSVIL